jgi:hypothetical protein
LYARYGNLTTLLKRLDLPTYERGGTPLSGQQLIDSLRRADAMDDKPLTSHHYVRLRREQPHMGLASESVIRKHLGSWANALVVAGLTR